MIKQEEDQELNKRLGIFGKKKHLSSQSPDYFWFEGETIILSCILQKNFIFKYITIADFTTKHDNIDPTIYQKDFAYFFQELKNKKIDFVSCPPSYLIFPIQPDETLGIPFGTVINDLKQSEADLFKNLHGKHRNVVRKAEKDGVEFLRGKEFKDECFDIVKETLDRENIDFIGKKEFDDYCEKLDNNIEFFLVKKDGVAQGAGILPYDQHSAYYLWGGSIKKPHIGSMNFLHWKAMMHFKNIGVKKYDFVGVRLSPDKLSKLYGIKRFKTRFGGPTIEGVIWKKTLNKPKHFLFKLAIFIKTKKLPSDIIEKVLNEK